MRGQPTSEERLSGFVLMFCLAAAPTVAVTAPEVVGLEARPVEAWFERFGALLGEGGRVRVMSHGDVAALLGLERQRQLLGCEESSCIAEVVGGLGAEGLLRGSVTKSGSSLTLVVKVIKTRDGSAWFSATERVADVDAAQRWLDGLVKNCLEALAPPPAPSSTVATWVPAMVGGALLVAGGVLLGLAQGKRDVLRTSDALLQPDIDGLVATGRTFEWVGAGLAALGGVGVITSLVLFAVGAPKPSSQLGVVVTPAGAALTFAGVW